MASSDLVNMGVSVVSYTIKDIRDDEVQIIILDVAYMLYIPPSPCLHHY